jgi:hypothetical protein
LNPETMRTAENQHNEDLHGDKKAKSAEKVIGL